MEPGQKNDKLEQLKADAAEIAAARGFKTVGFDAEKMALILEKDGHRTPLSLRPYIE
jgi:hypothetical protein